MAEAGAGVGVPGVLRPRLGDARPAPLDLRHGDGVGVDHGDVAGLLRVGIPVAGEDRPPRLARRWAPTPPTRLQPWSLPSAGSHSYCRFDRKVCGGASFGTPGLAQGGTNRLQWVFGPPCLPSASPVFPFVTSSPAFQWLSTPRESRESANYFPASASGRASALRTCAARSTKAASGSTDRTSIRGGMARRRGLGRTARLFPWQGSPTQLSQSASVRHAEASSGKRTRGPALLSEVGVYFLTSKAGPLSARRPRACLRGP
jgi:hypothetical protein